MSISLVLKAISYQEVKSSTSKLVLICLANYADEKCMCWPSNKRIAHDCKISLSSVKVHINYLCEIGALKREERIKKTSDGNITNTSNLYTLNLPDYKEMTDEDVVSEDEDCITDDVVVVNDIVEKVTDTVSKKEVNKNKEVKPKKDDDLDFSSMKMNDEQVEEMKRIRKKNKGGALTQRVINALAKEFEISRSFGFDTDDILTEWEVRSWKSLKAEWIKPRNCGFNNNKKEEPKSRKMFGEE